MKGWKKLLLGATAVALAGCHAPVAGRLSDRHFYPHLDLSQIDTVSAPLEERIRDIKTRTGKPFFSSEEINALHRTNTLENALDFSKNSSHSALDIVRYSKLGVTRKDVDEFTDTEKPNAILIFPSGEENISDTSAFYNRYNRILTDRIRKEYDLLVKIATLESEICEATSTAKNAEVLILAGHGSKYGLMLGNAGKDKRIKAPTEEFFLEMDDLEDLRKCFSTLNPNAVILLSSCSNAEEDRLNNNFANLVRRASNYKNVIAAKKSFRASGIKVNSIYPFSARILKEHEDKSIEDVTYIGERLDEIDLAPFRVGLTKTLKVPNFFKK